jgi:polyhydroxyalkanoate synthesis repressor PhaR
MSNGMPDCVNLPVPRGTKIAALPPIQALHHKEIVLKAFFRIVCLIYSVFSVRMGWVMAKTDGQIVIKKYANRRLYNTGTSTYVTLDDLAVMVKKGEEFTVQDAKSGEDITHSVLTQIIFEQESKTGNTLLPISFLRQLISYYGDQMQMVVPSYLEHSMQAFGEQQSQMREQITRAFGDNPLAKNLQLPIQMVEEQVRRNTDMFQQAMQMFAPFGAPAAPRETKKAEAKDIDELKEQLRVLQTKLDNL